MTNLEGGHTLSVLMTVSMDLRSQLTASSSYSLDSKTLTRASALWLFSTTKLTVFSLRGGEERQAFSREVTKATVQ